MAVVLAGVWRPQPPPLDLSQRELEEVAPLLPAAGCGALAWHRIRDTALAQAPAASELRQWYRRSALQAMLHERTIATVIAQLRRVAVEPVLLKGWAAARAYAHPGLRPYGDIDLCVRPEQESLARAVVAPFGATVDLHGGLADPGGHAAALPDAHLSSLLARSRLVPLRPGGDVRVLAPEDNLALLCTHLLAHGCERPLHLCDIAAALETLPRSFDWDRCLGQGRSRLGRIAWAIQLANRLLHAQTDEVPDALTGYRLPAWLEPAVLHRWGTPTSVWGARGRQGKPVASSLASAGEAARALRARWPNPIRAATELVPPVWWVPKRPLQLISFVLQIVRYTRAALHARAGHPRVGAAHKRPQRQTPGRSPKSV